ncbi:rhodanese-like domain-containing protein [Sulfuriferula nivalis]|uniref:Rhodanese-like domain-containing protein n=1 Tax=Sulfuriferula nivalis TaxID=2675298 RepID=A0A809RMA6_9PROT|nr:rhodanese-like domain-containing protein [Sulfuriferula nivalis]BBP01924.1 rhodanese-like domain-containing protein [Sulfuriferula nivalis]
MQQLSAAQLNEWLSNPSRTQPILLDVREPWEYQIAHLSNAQLMPMHTVPEQMQTLDKQAPVVVICHHGVRSMHIARLLEHHQFTDLYNLSGGINAWAHSVDLDMAVY